jgi:hypothetical protein
VDVAGAECLTWSIEQQQNWRQAAAVLDGRQPPTDPDLEQLEMINNEIRLYAVRVTRGRTFRICKRLVEGVWEHGMLEEGSAGEPVAAEAMARVA